MVLTPYSLAVKSDRKGLATSGMTRQRKPLTTPGVVSENRRCTRQTNIRNPQELAQTNGFNVIYLRNRQVPCDPKSNRAFLQNNFQCPPTCVGGIKKNLHHPKIPTLLGRALLPGMRTGKNCPAPDDPPMLTAA